MSTEFSGEPEVMEPKHRYLGNPNLPTVDAEFEWTPAMVKELKKCKEDIFEFVKHFYITSLDEGKIKIPLYKCQRRILRALLAHRFVVVLASRQIGKTTLVTIYALWAVCFQPDFRVLIVANKEDTAIKIFRRIRTAYEMLPNYLKPGVKEWGKTGMVLANDASIGISTTTSDAARGDTVNCLFIDELASVNPNLADEYWKATIPVISSSKKAKVFAVSTPRGNSGKFYEIWNGAIRNENGWHPERVDWFEIPGRNEKWKREMISSLGSVEAFRQEFENVFLESGQSPIDVELIEELKTRVKKPKIILEDGDYKIFAEPIINHVYTIGVDVGEGIGQAASVAQIFDITDLTKIEQTAVFHNNKLDPHSFATKIYMIANQWGRPPLLIERNNCGAQVIDALIHNFQYMNLVDYITGPHRNDGSLRKGIYAHLNSKYKGIMNMRYWMNTLRSVSISDIATIQEIETFVRHPNGTWRKKSGDCYDDRVMAMVWALFALETEIAERYYDIVKYDEKGKPLKIQSLELMDKAFYVLDKSTTISDFEPLRPHFGSSMGNAKQPDFDELLADGWQIL